MTVVSRRLPDYSAPPLIEVALSIQFESLDNLRTPQMGLLWSEFRNKFPLTEEQQPINPQIERFVKGAPTGVGPSLQLMEKAETPRCWFLNQLGNELVQVQKDRFVVNWRKRGDQDQYPRYEQIRERLRREFDIFQRFIEREKVGELHVTQCDVTYVNHIIPGKCWERHGQVDRVITLWTAKESEPFLSEPEDVRFAVRYIIPNDQGQPIGRLHLDLQPAFLKKDSTPVFFLTLIARGRSQGDGIDGSLAFLDIGHEWIVRGFTSITTKEMHQIWGRQNGK